MSTVETSDIDTVETSEIDTVETSEIDTGETSEIDTVETSEIDTVETSEIVTSRHPRSFGTRKRSRKYSDWSHLGVPELELVVDLPRPGSLARRRTRPPSSRSST